MIRSVFRLDYRLLCRLFDSRICGEIYITTVALVVESKLVCQAVLSAQQSCESFTCKCFSLTTLHIIIYTLNKINACTKRNSKMVIKIKEEKKEHYCCCTTTRECLFLFCNVTSTNTHTYIRTYMTGYSQLVTKKRAK